MSDGLDLADYLVGSAALCAVVGVVAWGAWHLPRRVGPGLGRSAPRLVEAVLFVAVPIGIAQVLGSFDALRAAPVALACVAAGIAMGFAGRRYAPSPPPQDDATPSARGPVLEMVGVAIAASVVAAQWATHVGDAFGRGMTHPDTVWYHAPYAAKFFESASLAGVPDRTDVIQAYYPLNSSLVHSLVAMPFGTDLLSPLVNLFWVGLALVAAWCIGRRYGAAPVSVLGAVVVIGLPMLGATQPGQASNDVMVAALLLSAVAVLLESRLAPAPVAVAGIAAGLALGTKLTVLVPVAVLGVGVIVLALRAGRRVTALTWTVAVAVSGAYWYVHNWVVADNPLPWFSVELGPISLPQSVEDEANSLFDNLTYGEGWREVFGPGFSQALGRAWPLVLALTVATGVVVVLRRRVSMEGLVGLSVVGAVVGYLITPSSGGLNFVFNTRYLTPALLLAFAVIPVAIEGLAAWWRRGTVVVLLALVVVNAASSHRERLPAWPSDDVAIGVVTGVVVLALGLLVARGRLSVPRRPAVVGGVVMLVALVAVGWFVQQRYLEGRYVDAGLPLDAIDEAFRDVSDADVVAFGTVETYPLFGIDLSNRVHTGQGPSTRRDVDSCVQFADVRAGRYEYVVLADVPVSEGGVIVPIAPPERWFTEDAASTLVARDGASVAYRVEGPLDPAECHDR